MRVADFVNGETVYRNATIVEDEAFKREYTREPEQEPTPEERIEAQVMYTALMTDTLLMED